MANTKGQNQKSEGMGMIGGAVAGLAIASNPVTAAVAGVAGVVGVARLIQGSLTRSEEIANGTPND